MRFLHKMFAVSALVLTIAWFAKGQAAPEKPSAPDTQTPLQGDEVFRKQLPDKSVFLLLRTPGVYVKRVLPPGDIAVVVDPDSVDVHSLFLVSADSKSHRLIWKRNFLVYLKNPSRQPDFLKFPEFKFYDVSLVNDRLVVLYRKSGELVGEVTDISAPATVKKFDHGWVVPMKITVSLNTEAPNVTAAHFEGPVVDGIPGIAATKITGEECHYIWKDGAWFEPNPKPKEVPPVPIREKPRPVAPDPNAAYRQEIILEKSPPGSHSMGEGLFVIRQLERPKTPSQPPSAAPSGDDEIEQPRRADLYTMTFYKYGKETGWSERALWSMRLESYTSDTPDLQVLDAVYDEPESAAIVYRRGGALYADVLRLDSEAGRAGLPRADARLDVGKLAPGQAPIQAKLEGSLKTDSLAVVVKLADRNLRFNFKNNKWVAAAGAG